MPIYEYICESCGETHEILQKISESDETRCPACGADALKKKISAAGFRLSGSGWYETDFKTKQQRNLTNYDGAKGASADKKGANGQQGGQQSDKKGGDAKSAKETKETKASSSTTPSTSKSNSAPAPKSTGASD